MTEIIIPPITEHSAFRYVSIIQNKIEKTSDLLDFNTSGYLYSRKDSSEINPVFIRKEKSN